MARKQLALHEMLEVELYGPITAMAKGNLQMYKGPNNHGRNTSISARKSDLYRLACFILYKHLNVECRFELEKAFCDSVAILEQYFLKKLWLDTGDMEDRMALDKDYAKCDLVWFAPLRNGLFALALGERWAEIENISQWFDRPLEPEFSDGEYEAELAYLYILIMAHFRGERFEGLDALEAKVAKCQKKRPKVLYLVWKALLDRDTAVYNKSFEQAASYFETCKGTPDLDSWVAFDLSTLHAIGLHMGMPVQHPEGRANAMLVTRQTLELG